MKLPAKAKTFEGFQVEERAIEALPVRIDYQAIRCEYYLRPFEDDWLLSNWPKMGQKRSMGTRESTNLDPYAIRDAFEEVKTVEDAVRFLSESGKFWPWEELRWSQFKEWQAFFNWLRLEPDRARKSSEGKRAWDTALGLGNSFFAQSDVEFSHSRFTPDAIEQYGPDKWKEIENADREMLRNLRHFAFGPERRNEGSRISLQWFDPRDKHPPEDWKARIKATRKITVLEPYLRVEALNVLEAIAATIFADRANRTKFAKCKHCGKLFKIESNHSQAFCPAPRHLKSSPCKNAYLQSERRNIEKQAVSFLLQVWGDGMNESEIKKEATAREIRITPQAVAKAKRRFQSK